MQTRKSNYLNKMGKIAAGLVLIGSTKLNAVASDIKNQAFTIDAWPLIESYDDSFTLMYPLYVNEGDFKMRWPVYYQTNNARDSHYMWPMIKIHDGRLVRAAPFWYSEANDDFVFFPFIWQKPDYSLSLFPPERKKCGV